MSTLSYSVNRSRSLNDASPIKQKIKNKGKNEIIVNDYGLLNRCWHASQVYLDTYATRQHSFENERISKRALDRRRRDDLECTSELSTNQKCKAFRFVNHHRENVSGRPSLRFYLHLPLNAVV